MLQKQGEGGVPLTYSARARHVARPESTSSLANRYLKADDVHLGMETLSGFFGAGRFENPLQRLL